MSREVDIVLRMSVCVSVSVCVYLSVRAKKTEKPLFERTVTWQENMCYVGSHSSGVLTK